MVTDRRLRNLFTQNVGMVDQGQVNLTLQLYRRLQNNGANTERFTSDPRLSAEILSASSLAA
jgi:hypothetical protein